jgi:HK97 family phage major capsid protein
MPEIIDLQKKQEELLEEARSINAKAENENRDLTEDEQTKFNETMSEVNSLAQRIKRARDLELKSAGLDREPDTSKLRNQTGQPGDGGGEKRFAEFADFVRAVVTGSQEVRDLNYGGAAGILVPEEWSDQIMAVDPDAEVVRPRAMVLPAGDSPDAPVHIPAFDQGASGYGGGIDSEAVADGTAYSGSSAPAFSDVKLEPQKFIYDLSIGNTLLRNTPALAEFLRRRFRLYRQELEDHLFIAGSGTSQPEGFVNSSAALGVSRNTSDEIKFEDIAALYTKIMKLNRAVWIANVSTRAQLLNMVDSSGNRVYQPVDQARGIGQAFYGLPILFTGNGAQLGSKGDISLVNLDYYMIKDGSGPFIGMSEHVDWKSDQTNMKLVWHVDGQSWVQAPITTKSGAQVSPFAVLNA